MNPSQRLPSEWLTIGADCPPLRPWQPGLAVTLVAYFCMEGVCTPKSFAGASNPSSAPILSKMAYDTAPYGTTTATEMMARGATPASTWARLFQNPFAVGSNSFCSFYSASLPSTAQGTSKQS